MNEASFIVTSGVDKSDTHTCALLIAVGGQKYSSPLLRSRYHSPGWSISSSTLIA